MKQRYLFFVLVIGFVAMATVSRAQMPGQPGSLSVGAVTANSIEWKFNLAGSMVSEVQLFVGDETTPKMTVTVPNYAMSVVETGLSPNTLYAKRRVKPVYFGTAGALSDNFPAGRTLSEIPSPMFEPIVGSQNAMIRVQSGFANAEELSGWQLYDVNRKELRGYVTGDSLQFGPFETGEVKVFRFRSRNADGVVTEWSGNVSYSLTAAAVNAMPPVPALPPVIFGGTARVNKNVPVLNVRSLASLSGKKIGRVRAGMEFSVLETKNGWHLIQYTPAVQGWIFGKYVTIN